MLSSLGLTQTCWFAVISHGHGEPEQMCMTGVIGLNLPAEKSWIYGMLSNLFFLS